MSKLRLRDNLYVPNGGYQFYEENVPKPFIATSVSRLVQFVKEYRCANKLSPCLDGKQGPQMDGPLREEIEKQLCEKRPNLCVDELGKPGLWQKAVNFAAASVEWAKEGFPATDEATYKFRSDTCRACPYFRGWQKDGIGTCRKCGCAVGTISLKLWMATTRCPENKW